jgi:hypothetical protein
VSRDADRLVKQRRAAAHLDRSGERCSAPAGTYIRVIDTPGARGSGTAST